MRNLILSAWKNDKGYLIYHLSQAVDVAWDEFSLQAVDPLSACLTVSIQLQYNSCTFCHAENLQYTSQVKKCHFCGKELKIVWRWQSTMKIA